MSAKLSHPALVLFLLSPVLGELVSGYRTPLEFLSPLNFSVTIVPYGCGALAVRELVVRCRRGWLSLVLLGAAFGLLFEGLVTRVIFNPGWEDLGALAGYGRAYGVNWILAVGVVHFHLAVSIVCAVLLAEMLYPARRAEPWIGRPALAVCCGVLPGWTLVIGALSGYVPPVDGTLALLSVVALLVAAALSLPGPGGEPRKPFARPALLGLVGGAGMTLMMVGTWGLPEWAARPPALAAFAGLVLVACAELGTLTWLNRAGAGWTDRHRLALIAGFLAFFLVFGAVQDLGSFAGRSLVSAATIWWLSRLRGRLAPAY